jgi:hypothetical protein
MKLKLFFLLTFFLTSSIDIYTQQTPQRKTQHGSSNATQNVNTNNQVSPYTDNLLKLPSIITKSTAHDTLTIRFEYGNSGEIKHIVSKNQTGIAETLSFQYLRSKIIYTLVSADNETSVDSIYVSDGLITKDPNYTYIYANRKLVEIKSKSGIGDHYTIQYDEAGNAIEQLRVIPPLTKDDEEVTQVATYKYDETLKAKFFFSTDWFFGPFSSFDDDVYRLPSASLFGLGSNNLVKEVTNDSKIGGYQYKYLSFDESGYPMHYAIYEVETNKLFDDYGNTKEIEFKENGKSELLADYQISYIVPVNVINSKWGCVDKNMKQIIPYKFDTATYKDFSFDGKAISCTKSGIRICMDTVGNMLSLNTNAGKSYKTICDAIVTGDVDAIKNFIDLGVDLNAQNKYRNKNYWVDNIIDGYPGELLMTTTNLEIKKNIVELLGLFIDHGFNINSKDQVYNIIAQVIRSEFSKDNKIKMLQIILDNHANVNEIGKNGHTPLMELCIMQTVFQNNCSDVYDVPKFLIEQGADPTIKNAAGNTAIKMIKKSDCKELIELLSKKKK